MAPRNSLPAGDQPFAEMRSVFQCPLLLVTLGNVSVGNIYFDPGQHTPCMVFHPGSAAGACVPPFLLVDSKLMLRFFRTVCGKPKEEND